jgi:hypothetical protein
MSSAPNIHANPTAAPSCPTDGQAASAGENADNARHVAWIREMGEMAMRMAATLHDQVTAPPDGPETVKRLPELCLAFTRVTRCARLAVVLEQELLGLRPVSVRGAAANGNRRGFARGERENGEGGEGEVERGERFDEYDEMELEARIAAFFAEEFPYGVPNVPFDPADPQNPLYLQQQEARREGMAHIEAILKHGDDVEWPPKTGPWSKPSPARAAHDIWFKAERERLRREGDAAKALQDREHDKSADEPRQCGPPTGGGFR